MLARILSGTSIGLEGVIIDVEVDVASRGFPTFTIVGLPSKAIDEAKDRVRTAITNTSFSMPESRITVNLAPADIPKKGASFDLPIAIGILAASGSVDYSMLHQSMFVGELSLEGKVRKVQGIISIALTARKKRIKTLFVPVDNTQEATLVDDIIVYPVNALADLILHLNGQQQLLPAKRHEITSQKQTSDKADFQDIKGQSQAKRALEVASAGFHNVLLTGPPGTGKTLLSRAFPSILPPMDKEEILEVSSIYSIAGLLRNDFLVRDRPFRSPHHTTSRMGLIGGGTIPAPGEISLSHRGVLFLDELPEFPRSVLESLRQPLEDGVVTIARANGTVMFPSRFILLAAANPCPCGYLGHPKKVCRCFPAALLNYRKRISGPLLDRVDIHVTVPPIDEEKLMSNVDQESSSVVQQRVVAARARQIKRFKGKSFQTNSEMSPADIKKLCQLTDGATLFLKQAIARFALSARSYIKVIKVAQTIADLSKNDIIDTPYVAEALQFRRNEE